MNEQTNKSSSEKCVILQLFGLKCRKGYNNLSFLSTRVFKCALVQFAERERENEKNGIGFNGKWLIKMCEIIWVGIPQQR